MLKGKYFRITIIASILVSLVLLVFIFLLCFLLYKKMNSNVIHHTPKPKSYVYMDIDISKNRTRKGFVQMTRPIEKDYISYTNEETDTYVIISRQQGTEYDCYGDCYCQDVSGRRVANIMTRGLYVLVSAASVALAAEYTKESFEEWCKKNVNCREPEHDLYANVRNCEVSPGEDPDTENKIRYDCVGYCENTKNRLEDIGLENLDKESFDSMGHYYGDCGNMETYGIVWMSAYEEQAQNSDIEASMPKGFNQHELRDRRDYYDIAKEKFRRDFLRSFCKQASNAILEHTVKYKQKHGDYSMCDEGLIFDRNVICLKEDWEEDEKEPDCDEMLLETEEYMNEMKDDHHQH